MPKKLFDISIIVPVYNEVHVLNELITRIRKAFKKSGYTYEIIFVDDHSNDGTSQLLKKFTRKDIVYAIKKGKKGKAYSLFEGFALSRSRAIAMIDGDLQYPPEELPAMIKKLSDADIVTSYRKVYEESMMRRILSRGFKLVFAKFLFALSCDVQSGMKVFKREVADSIVFHPHSGWSFDLEFLHRAQSAGYIIKNHNITFEKRSQGKTKLSYVRTVFELAGHATSLRFRRLKPLSFQPIEKSMINAGVRYRKQKFVTHTTLPYSLSALETFVGKHKIFIITFLALITAGLIRNPIVTFQVAIAVLSFIYLVDTIFNAFLVLRSLRTQREITISQKEYRLLNDDELPIYSILCPLYKEAQMVPQFISSIEQLDWPKDKLDVLILLEEEDNETIEAVKSMRLPSYFRIITVPDSHPKTKPKACNYGLAHAIGEFIVIYDAEDKPEAGQLKKAFIAFHKSSSKVACLQAKLNYYNPDQNILTRLFTAEYSLWFDVTLTGLQSFDTSIPLGGTSNHFRTQTLMELMGWDPFNVTEDADLGIRLFKKGYKTAIINSTTYEEANSRSRNWIRQRSRWIKGYMQTYLVHNRDFITFLREGKLHAALFHLTIGGKIAFILINPFLWITTILYFTLRSTLGPIIETFYPAPVFYMAVMSLAFGNFMFMYYYMIGCAKREQWSLIKYVFLIPLYWVLLSVAGFMAFYQLLFKPHYWEKTAHGFHLAPVAVRRAVVQKTNEDDDPFILKPGIATPLAWEKAYAHFSQSSREHLHISKKLLSHAFSPGTVSFNGVLFSFLTIGLHFVDTTSYTFPIFSHETISFGMLSLFFLVAYILFSPLLFSQRSKSVTHIIHSLSIIAFATSTIHIISVINTQSLSNDRFILFSIIEASSLSALMWYFLRNGKSDNAQEILPEENTTGLKILIFNWRDIKHVWAGGAEIYIHELAKRWVAEGNAVTILSSNDRHNPTDENIDGVHIVRKGGSYTVYLRVLLYYLFRLRGKYDVIIDCENGIPFFTPLFAKEPVFLLIYHVHQDILKKHLIFPLSYIAQWVEAHIMPLVYRNNRIITISESSKNDLYRLGFARNHPIDVVYSGVNHSLLKPLKKSPHPSFIYIGRLKEYKNIDVALKAFAKVLKKHPQARLTIAGDGGSRSKLTQLSRMLKIEKNVTFTGKVTELEKAALLGMSWIALQPSETEGWGITVIESNACATPVIASNVSGLCDSVVDMKTGMLVPVRNISVMAKSMNQLISDSELRNSLALEAREWSSNFNWDISARQFYSLISNPQDPQPKILLQPSFIAQAKQL